MSAGRGRCAKQCRVPEAKLYKDSVSPPAPQASGEVCQLLSVPVGFSPVYASNLNTAFAKPRRVLLLAFKRIHFTKFKVGRLKVIHEGVTKKKRRKLSYPTVRMHVLSTRLRIPDKHQNNCLSKLLSDCY